MKPEGEAETVKSIAKTAGFPSYLPLVRSKNSPAAPEP